MKIIVLVKQVPDTTEIKLDPKTGNLIREGIASIMNPDDRHALEAAVGLKESLGGSVTTLSMGPPQAIDVITEAIGMGADRGILLSDGAFAGADTWATSLTLGKAIETIGDFDLIICGRQAIDGDTAQIGPQVADHLGIPHVSYVFKVDELSLDRLVVRRRLEDGFERIHLPLPALVTVIGELNVPRYANVGRLIAACGEKAKIDIWNAADIGCQTRDLGLEGSLTHVIKTFAPKFKRQGEILEGNAEESIGKLLGKLHENRIL